MSHDIMSQCERIGHTLRRVSQTRYECETCGWTGEIVNDAPRVCWHTEMCARCKHWEGNRAAVNSTWGYCNCTTSARRECMNTDNACQEWEAKT